MDTRIAIKRIFKPAAPEDGEHYLVDRVWPRGVARREATPSGWAREAAPSRELRGWFAHDPAKWEEFRRRYRAELEAAPVAWRPLLEAARRERVSLVYGARDEQHNQAVVLYEFLEETLSRAASGGSKGRAA
jgi:uncharacterized protein YeaO (DUF488 family)